MRDIPGYEGRYAVTIDGRVWSYPKVVGRQKERFLKAGIGKKQYLQVSLYNSQNKTGKTIGVHRLVAITYLPNPKNLPVVNHKDGNKLNNNVENLEWCTDLENKKHALDTGLFSSRGEKNPRAKISEKQVLQIRSLRKKGNTYRQLQNQFKISKSTIASLLNGTTWKHVI